MNAAQRSNALNTVLFERGLGRVLCKKFRAYWNPKVMLEYMERAAAFSKQRESTLNITYSIQTKFKALFIDFCVYMLTRANDNYNLDIIYADEISSSIRKLFMDIFEVFPVPKLDELGSLSAVPTLFQNSVHASRFPFFSFVHDAIENEVEKSQKHLKLDLLDSQLQVRIINDLVFSIYIVVVCRYTVIGL